ncbi:hypothetical protein CC117_10940 [Parafrankia colletiae]|uniref:Uncharacterized protein n=1 Tax=Parafrankia colletiae TaxID=573497 RepID=A0A1S1RAY0_9ACTN|nr:hypothetical protein CC117_10940 [Parafrankia colletiae]
MIPAPVALKCDIERRHGLPDFRDGDPKGQNKRFEVAADIAGEIYTDRDYPACLLLQWRPVASLEVAGSQMFGQATRKCGLTYAANTVEDENVTSRDFQVFHVE